jgi:DNA-binding transcriptional LysR family regulator
MAMAEFQGHYKGPLQIGGSTIPGGYLLPKLIGRFNRSYPNIRISLMIADSEEIVKKTLDGGIEIGVVGARFSNIHLNQTPLTHDTLKLITPPNHCWSERASVAIEDLRQAPMIVREAGSGTLDTIKEAFRAKGIEFDHHFNIIAEIGNTAGVIGGIKSGLGVSILSVRAVEDELHRGTLAALDIEGIDLRRQFYLISDPRRTRSPLALVFWDNILNSVHEDHLN